ncbi:hypothetical protein HK102_005777 [Quaeritorhiza haematococci]|nr:hypothetical protein HK102_005777 [Quaeritorhiza haematococci]
MTPLSPLSPQAPALFHIEPAATQDRKPSQTATSAPSPSAPSPIRPTPPSTLYAPPTATPSELSFLITEIFLEDVYLGGFPASLQIHQRIFTARNREKGARKSTILDIGANVGVFNLFCAALFEQCRRKRGNVELEGPTADHAESLNWSSKLRVWAFEPIPANCEALERNVQMYAGSRDAGRERLVDVRTFRVGVGGIRRNPHEEAGQNRDGTRQERSKKRGADDGVDLKDEKMESATTTPTPPDWMDKWRESVRKKRKLSEAEQSCEEGDPGNSTSACIASSSSHDTKTASPRMQVEWRDFWYFPHLPSHSTAVSVGTGNVVKRDNADSQGGTEVIASGNAAGGGIPGGAGGVDTALYQDAICVSCPVVSLEGILRSLIEEPERQGEIEADGLQTDKGKALDDAIVDLLKIDVEGSEMDVLMSVGEESRYLWERVRHVVVEVQDDELKDDSAGDGERRRGQCGEGSTQSPGDLSWTSQQGCEARKSAEPKESASPVYVLAGERLLGSQDG